MKQQIFYEDFDSFYYYSGSSRNWEMKGFHFHKEYEVILFLSEGAVISIGNRVYEVERGDLFLIPNREYHKTAGADGQEYRRYVLMFEPEPVWRASEALGYPFMRYFEHGTEAFPHKLHLTGERLENTVALFERIGERCHERETAAGQTGIRLGILELLLYVNQMFDFFGEKDCILEEEMPEADENAAVVQERISQIKKYINAHIDEKLELEQIAEHFYISRHYLSHYFKKATGFTLGQYIMDRKMDRAKQLLRQGLSVTETAVALSYHSDSHFINTSKRMTGTTPKRYAAEKPT